MRPKIHKRQNPEPTGNIGCPHGVTLLLNTSGGIDHRQQNGRGACMDVGSLTFTWVPGAPSFRRKGEPGLAEREETKN